MKILIISNLFPPHVVGGYEILCGQVASGLRVRGHSVSVLTSSWKNGSPAAGAGEEEGPEEAETGRTYRRMKLLASFDAPYQRSRRARRKVTIYNHRIAKEVIREEAPDLIFVWSQLRLSVGAARAAEESGIPVCYTMNDNHLAGYAPAAPAPRPRALAAAFLDRTAFLGDTSRALRLEHVTCISHSLVQDLSGAGLRFPNTEVIHQGIPVDLFPPKENPGSLHLPLRLLYCGQLHPYKGPATLISAAEIVGARRGFDSVRVTLVGDGPMRAELEVMGRSSRVAVEVLGPRPHAELPAIYRDHDILAFTSIWREPFGLTHLEAMASGTTVVSTATGGQAEFLRDQENALLFPEGSADGLAQQIEGLMSDPDMSVNLAHTARRDVAEGFSLQRYVGDIERWLHEVRKMGVEN